MSANGRTIALEMLLAGFFAVAWMRASVPAVSSDRLQISKLFFLPGRLERFQRSRWQWFSMVGLMLVLRLQGQLPLILEVMAALQLVVFLAIPSRSPVATKLARKGDDNEAVVGSR